ncbi:MAG: hypothetical protein FD119_487 [Stygiobacter sp.]|nr:MAG: hypothetical protein FD119_487 [Stygiobacter sp.]
MPDEKLLILPREFVRENLPDLVADVCIAALDAAIASAMERQSQAEAASELRTISNDTAFALALMSDYVEK